MRPQHFHPFVRNPARLLRLPVDGHHRALPLRHLPPVPRHIKRQRELGTAPPSHRTFLVHNIVHAFLTVEFEVTWRQSSIPAGEPDPQTVAIRFQKTWGTVFIDILRGSIVLRQGDAEGITEIELIEQIQAAQGGTDNIESYLTDLYQSVRARVHDQPLPQY